MNLITRFRASHVEQYLHRMNQDGTKYQSSGISNEFQCLNGEKIIFDRNSRVRIPYDDDDNQFSCKNINANYIDCSRHGTKKVGKKYIASQGPTSQTAEDFWRMVWYEKVQIIVMATPESSFADLRYWPDMDKISQYGCMAIRCLMTDLANPDYTLREFEISNSSNEEVPRRIFHFSIKEWPDFGLPKSTESFLSFLMHINEKYQSFPTSGPVLVHCRAGIGRSGTFIASDILVDHVLHEGLSCEIDVYQTVSLMRRMRPYMVETEQQYRFIYSVLQSVCSDNLALNNFVTAKER